MKNKLISILIVFLLVVAGFLGFMTFEVKVVSASTTIYVGSGAGNDSATINGGISLANDGDTVYVYGGTYYEHVYITKTLNLIGENKEWTIIDGNGFLEVVYVSANWVNITGFTITHGTEGIYISGTSNNTITNNNIMNNGYGIYLFSSSHNTISNNNVSNNKEGFRIRESLYNIISQNNISDNDQGIQLWNSNNTTITNNNFVNDDILIRGNSLQHFNSHTIPENNLVNGKPLYYYKDSSNINIDNIPVGELILANCTDFNVKNLQIDNTDIGIELGYSTNILIANNNISHNDGGIGLFYSSNNTIISNDVLNNEDGGIGISYSSNNNIIINNNVIANNNTSSSNDYGIGIGLSFNNIITNNTISNHEVGIQIGTSTMDNSSNNIVTGNNISNNNRSGIFIGWTSDNEIIGNNISDNGQGLKLHESLNNSIIGNDISNNVYSLNFHESSNNNIIGNNIFNNDYGVYFHLSSNSNITSNDISGNLFGIFITVGGVSSDNIINSNNITNNDYGIYLNWTYNNVIYHNNIINNTNQANDTANNMNQWDNGYPSGGNYWSDFDEPGDGAYDDYQGSDQDVLGSDGIVDNGTIGGGGKNPYAIDSNSRDNYPLINPGDTSPPTITNLQPPDGSSTNNNIPTISADYSDPSGINVSSVVILVDGIDVTAFATVTAGGASYIPGLTLSDGIHTVYLEVKDIFGNLATATWSFTVDTFLPPIANLTTIAVNDGNNVELEWDPSPSPTLDHYLIYRADSATDFDFTVPYISSTTWPDPKNTSWVDPDPSVTAVDDDFYYIVRAANSDESDISSTSNTAGVWTRTFQSGISTFSLPLETFVKKDTEFYCQDMNASYIKWMNLTTRSWMQHDKGDSQNNTLMEVGEGYEIGFLAKSIQTRYTFTGLPGAMIIYDDEIVFSGFDPATDAKSFTASVDAGGNVTLTWHEPASMGLGDWYEVYYSNTRDGFFETLGIDYFLACPSLGFGNNSTTISSLGANDPGTRLYFMVVPFNSLGIKGASIYSIGIWTEEYLSGYDTIGIPLKLNTYQFADWYCDNIPDTVGMNYYIYSEQRWGWHTTRMPQGAFDPVLGMTEGYQISTLSATKFTFIGT